MIAATVSLDWYALSGVSIAQRSIRFHAFRYSFVEQRRTRPKVAISYGTYVYTYGWIRTHVRHNRPITASTNTTRVESKQGLRPRGSNRWRTYARMTHPGHTERTLHDKGETGIFRVVNVRTTVETRDDLLPFLPITLVKTICSNRNNKTATGTKKKLENKDTSKRSEKNNQENRFAAPKIHDSWLM